MSGGPLRDELGEYFGEEEKQEESHLGSADESDGMEDGESSANGLFGDAPDSMLARLVPLQIFKPLVERLQAAITQHDNVRMTIELEQSCTVIMQLVDTFGGDQSTIARSSDLCGIGPTLVYVLDTFTQHETIIAALRCIKLVSECFPLARNAMIKENVLQRILNYLLEIEVIDLAEAALDCLDHYCSSFPRLCLDCGTLEALFLHFFFFDATAQRLILKIASHLVHSLTTKDAKEATSTLPPVLVSFLRQEQQDPESIYHCCYILTNLSLRNRQASESIPADLLPRLQSIFYSTTDERVIGHLFDLFVCLCEAQPEHVQFETIINLAISRIQSMAMSPKHFNIRSERLLKKLLDALLNKLCQRDSPSFFLASLGRLLGLDLSLTILTERKETIPCDHQAALSLLSALEMLYDQVALSQNLKFRWLLLCVTILYCDPLTFKDLSGLLSHIASEILEIYNASSMPLRAIASLAFSQLVPLQIMNFLPVAQAEELYNSIQDIWSSTISGMSKDSINMLIELLESFLSALGITIPPNNDTWPSLIAALSAHLPSPHRPSSPRTMDELMSASEYYILDSQLGTILWDYLERAKVDDMTGKVIGHIHRCINRLDYGLPIRLLSPSIAHQALRPVRIFVTLNAHEYRLSNSMLLADWISNIDGILHVLLNGESRRLFGFESLIDLTGTCTHKSPLKRIDWTDYECSLSVGLFSNVLLSPFKPLLSAVVKNIEDLQNLPTIVQNLFRQDISIHIYRKSLPLDTDDPITCTSATNPGLIPCLELLDEFARLHADEHNPWPLLINARLTGKLHRQLKQLLVICTGIRFEEWDWIVERAPYLFDFDTKIKYMQNALFGTARFLDRMQHHLVEEHGEDLQFRLARMPRIKLVVDRENFMEHALHAVENYSQYFSTVIEYQFLGDAGVGLGPTMEFYTLFSQKLQECTVQLWQDDGLLHDQNRVHWREGLYPKFGLVSAESLRLFHTLGLLLARAILDNRLVDIPLNCIFVEAILGRRRNPSLRTLRQVDGDIAQTLSKLRNAKEGAFEGLTFTLPSNSQIVLCPDGDKIPVTLNNFDEFLDLLLRFILERAIGPVVEAFRTGFKQVLPIKPFSILTAQQFLSLLNGEVGQDWTVEKIMGSLQCSHGYTTDSVQVRWMAEVFCELSLEERKLLVQFLTGGPQLPTGGWRMLRPHLTVVCRTGDNPDDSLPTVMTCTNYFKLPKYSSKETLRHKLRQAIYEGRQSFLLS